MMMAATVAASRETTHYCNLCSFAVSDSGSLLFHTALAHRIRTRYECEQCEQAFEFRELAAIHVLHSHMEASFHVESGTELATDTASYVHHQPEVVLKLAEDDLEEDGEELEEEEEANTACETNIYPAKGTTMKRSTPINRLSGITAMIGSSAVYPTNNRRNNGRKRYSEPLSPTDEKRAKEQRERIRAMATVPLHELTCQVSTCGKVLSSKSSMANHIDSVHLRLRPYKCPTCGQGFALKQHMRTHVREVHERERVACSLCGKTYSSKVGLHYHHNTVHRNLVFACNVCGKTFSQRGTLVTHMKASHPHAEIPPKEETERIYNKNA